MEPIHSLLLPPGYEIEEMRTEGPAIGIRAATQHRTGICPGCGRESRQIHGYYRREFDDLPISGFTVRFRLKADGLDATTSNVNAKHLARNRRILWRLIKERVGG